MGTLVTGKNDLKTWCIQNHREDLLAEWENELNGSLTPSTVAKSSNKPVWWRCPKCKTPFATSPGHRTQRNSACPLCAKELRKINWAKPREKESLADLFPDIAKEWDPTNEKKAVEVRPQSRYMAKWICSQCGNSFTMHVYSRTGKEPRGCPVCARKRTILGTTIPAKGKSLLDLFPEVCEEWDYTRNSPLLPSDLKPTSTKKVWWICKRQGHRWLSDPAHKTRGKNRCPKCSAGLRTSYPERVVLFYLKK